MAILSDSEIFAAALQAGFTPDQAVTMTAIALAESGGNTGALNSTGEYSVGLWQINTAVHDWDPAVAEDPLQNARMAFEVSGGGADISRWTVTHEEKGARYLAFRARAESAAAAAGYGDARGQWDPPLNYHDNRVGAAPGDSTSTALHEPGTIAAAPDDDAAGEAMEATAPARTSAFDGDGDGVFDAVEEWLGEDLLPDQSNLPDLPDGAVFHPVDDPVDVSTLRNGQVAREDLVAAAGGDDFLLEGAPSNSWNAMVAAAKADGVDITYGDAYRSLEHQHDVAERLGLFSEGGMAARPGTSNHGLGLAIDLDWSGEANRATREWMLQNAASYGWEQHSAAREAHHWTYREELDPDPDRWLGTGPGGAANGDERAVGHVFDRDGDGVYDAIADWLAPEAGLSGHGDHGHGEHTHGDDAHGGHSHGDAAPSEDGAAVGHGAACQCGQCVGVQVHDAGCQCAGCAGNDDDPDSLPPLNASDDSGLAEVLGRFDLDGQGDLMLEGMSGEDRDELRSALADFVVDRAEIDRESFLSRFDHTVDDELGSLDLGDVLDVFGLDLDL